MFCTVTPDTVERCASSIEAPAMLQEVHAAVEEAAEAAGLRPRRLDKKLERQLVHQHRKALEAQLAREADPAAALSLVVPLLVAQVRPTQTALLHDVGPPRANR
jgi:hypothetical protein